MDFLNYYLQIQGTYNVFELSIDIQEPLKLFVMVMILIVFALQSSDLNQILISNISRN